MLTPWMRLRVGQVETLESVGEPIRVAFVIDALSAAGTESQLLALIRSIDRAKVVPHLVLLNGDDPASQALEPRDCPVMRLGIRKLLAPSTLRKAIAFRRWLREQRIDIVQAYFYDSVHFAVPIARWAGVPRVIRVQNNSGYSLTGMRKRMTQSLSRFIDWTLTNSDTGKADLIARQIARPETIQVMENGVDLVRFRGIAPIDPSEPIRRIGMVGNLRPVKNIDGLIRSMVPVVRQLPDVMLEIAGEGPDRPALESLIADLGLTANVRLLGSISDIPGFLARQQIAVLASHSEGMSNAVLEYLAAGRAVVATKVGANARLIPSDDFGVLVPAGDGDALSAALLRVCQNSTLAARLGANARQRVEREWSRESMCRRFEQFYAQILGRGFAPRIITGDDSRDHSALRHCE
ncbi:glycosyltransferase [Tuwongella immobilis]|uniref:Glycosyltransferase subfamily 4-like N-terminal domain-containing protein n=1 Tax=Tuwongella immobilis TaxID=692036 RepID=A0A6C2YNV6_9BACT|nr:glycosyltransferase [Tuwongella immobilis]VIP02813.1 Glycosyl transferase group 1 OS=Desulfovibrio sp. X2 GN=dsx2_1181 PE=4 SV=1: Glyco_trans_4_4: Glycos_transf_1 [Tuwongella immobilis]VTS02527.1 Glycosyl transferase group 1 OS=Desulfovibrio sp. X2 GN=dsx2_1181 PE=4 SV=1: Glyco_trans_4_4: Glycos_transf_1 [Tuwongella immobilis]